MTKIPKKLKIVEVDWEDITSYSAWREKEELPKCTSTYIRSTGYLIDRDKKQIRIAMSLSDDCGIACIKVIPMGVVRKIRKIR